ncbi:MAG: Ig-like domain-containing protein [bacterium]
MPDPIIRRIAVILFAILWLVSLSGCARQIRPSGGPADKVPPEIVGVAPRDKATNVARDQRIEFEFSEAMNRKSLQKAVFIAPDPGEEGVRFKWKGRKLRIEFADSLKADRTYVITLGTDLKDAHGNALAHSYTLAFSTGATISDGKIAGRVYAGDSAQGILIWAYILDGERDSNPEQETASYVTQTDAQGKYELSHLSAGRYRVFAMQDKDRNRFFEVGVDGLGVPQGDVTLIQDSLAVQDVDFKVAIQDTLGPALVSVSANHRAQVALLFDEALAVEGTAEPQNYRIVAAGKGERDALEVVMAYLNPLDAQAVMLVTEPQQAGSDYELSVVNLRDQSGNVVDPDFGSDVFTASAVPDTFKPQIVRSVPQDSARAVLLNSGIALIFHEPIQKSVFEHSFTVSDSAGQSVEGELQWPTPVSATFVPQRPWRSLQRYRVSVKLDSVIDVAGNATRDSLWQISFTTVNADTFSSISGTVADPDSTQTGRIFLRAAQEVKDGPVYELQLDGPGAYEFKNLLPGTYRLEGFRDRNGDGKYSFGRPVPFEPAERFFVYPDAIKVRARWPNEGNDLLFKN